MPTYTPHAVFLCRYFRDPKPSYRVVLDDVSTFLGEMARSLKGGVNRLCFFSFVFRRDVFMYLFAGKGKACPHRLGSFYYKEDFDEAYFPPDWFLCCDRLGDSCRISFPVRMYCKIVWSPLVYSKDAVNVVAPKKRSFKQLLYVHVSKQCC